MSHLAKSMADCLWISGAVMCFLTDQQEMFDALNEAGLRF